MADNNDDKRMMCRFGTRCYQKNPLHHAKYKHPPKKDTNTQKKVELIQTNENPKRKSSDDSDDEDKQNNKKPKVSSEASDSNSELKMTDSDHEMADFKISNDVSDSDSESKTNETTKTTEMQDNSSEEASVSNSQESTDRKDFPTLPIDLNAKGFIKEKFLCDMPEDFYEFWEFCKELKKEKPAEAFAGIGLHLVGPYDVLAGKFNGVKDRPIDEYLLHWRYFYDPPGFQTIVSGDKPDGFHIGYFRDDMKENPVFLASNCSKKDGTFEIIGDNIFAAIILHLEEFKKTCDPFKKSQISSILGKLKNQAESKGLNLSRRTDAIRKRKVVATTNNRLGISVPFNKRSELGYRELALNDKDFNALMLKMKSAHADQFPKLLDDLQPVLTYASIALDECDFGTGVKLGWELLYFGVEKMNNTIAQYLANSYNLLGKPELAQIAEAHMKNRRSSIKPSVAQV